MCVRDAGMPRKEFVTTFPRNETNLKWLGKHIKGGKKYSQRAGAASRRRSSAPEEAGRPRGHATS